VLLPTCLQGEEFEFGGVDPERIEERANALWFRDGNVFGLVF